jgi:Tol biopolymer transport system component
MGAIIATSIVDTNGISFDIYLAPESRVFEGDSVFYNIGDSQWYQDGQHLYVWGSVEGPSASPVCGENSKGEIFLLQITTGHIVNRLSHNSVDECGFQICPDGSRILLTRGPYQTDRKIFLMRLSDTLAKSITSGKNDQWPRWSSDSKLIVFTKDENDDQFNDPYFSNRIYVLDMNSFKQKRISPLIANEPDIY